MHNFKNLKIWTDAVELSIAVYSATISFPDAEKFGLISQLRRASVSVPSNIAEVETQLIIAGKLKFLEQTIFDTLITEITELRKMIFGFIKNLKNQLKNEK